MRTHRLRSHLTKTSAGVASFLLGCAHHGPGGDAASLLIERSRSGNAALMRGDIERYVELVPIADDFTLFSPFGAEPTRGPLSRERVSALGRFFREGTFEQEVVQSYATGDMVVLALVERARVGVGGLPVQDWALRVTLVYRREGNEWVLVHRHADPLVAGITLPEAAELAGRKRASRE
jgi:ketosteroid isomerase-like protein